MKTLEKKLESFEAELRKELDKAKKLRDKKSDIAKYHYKVDEIIKALYDVNMLKNKLKLMDHYS